MNLRRIPALLVAVFLQLAPLARTLEPVVTSVLQPLMVLFRLAATAAAVAGGAHAVSGATGLISAATAKGTNGIAFSYRAQITSDQYGKAKSYSASGLPTGLTVTSSTLGAIGGIPAKVGIFSVVITGYENSNKSGHSYSDTLKLTIVAGPPVITQGPLTQTVTEGGAATLSVTVTSSDTPTYRWIKDGVELAAATGPALQFSPVQLTDAGSYVCRVQNSGGIALSDPATLTVTPAAKPPSILSISPDKSVHPGETITLLVNATADVALAYQWFHGATPVPAGTLAALTLPQVTSGAAGSYTVVVSANNLSTTSSPVVVSVAGSLVAGPISSDSGGSTIHFNSIPGRHYFLESAPNPDSVSWQAVTDLVPTGVTASLTDPAPPNDLRFYRVRVQ